MCITNIHRTENLCCLLCYCKVWDHEYKSRTQTFGQINITYVFVLYFSQVTKPINATEDYIKTHSRTFKYIVLGILGAGNTKSLLFFVNILKPKVCSVAAPAYFYYDKTEIILSISTIMSGKNKSLLCSVGYVAYFIAACVLNFQRATALVVLTSLVVVAQSYELLKKYKGKSISRCFKPAVKCLKSNSKWMKWWVDTLFSVVLSMIMSCT